MLLLALLASFAQAAFVTEPYLQLGPRPAPDRLSILWHAPDADATWALEHQSADGAWMPVQRIVQRRVTLRGTRPFRIYEAELAGLRPGAEFDYRVLRDGAPVFTARGKAIAPPQAPARFAVVGDPGAGSAGQRAVASRINAAQPDAVIVPGDIVYPNGRLKHYLSKWFPIYQPVFRARISAAAPGNHDFEECADLAQPDCLAYFHVWSPPLNGPAGNAVALMGPAADQQAFKALAGAKFPQAANYSFDYGPVHWTILDSNHVMDWTRPDLRQWLENDLAQSHAPWKFVVFHHAPFHSSGKHAEHQRLRVLSPIFEAHGVAVVFAGHVHNYQRTHPIRFVAEPYPTPLGSQQPIPGQTIRDPNGVVYVLTGAGGAGLVDGAKTGRPSTWLPFTAHFEARQHSFTQIDANPELLRIRQIGADGRELDSFQIARK
ncbi:MAG: metallophosphoesterase [Bryobacteraceae bacterium]|nr:metallophosphoesterase [Bryobacteraceae bacterium]